MFESKSFLLGQRLLGTPVRVSSREKCKVRGLILLLEKMYGRLGHIRVYYFWPTILVGGRIAFKGHLNS